MKNLTAKDTQEHKGGDKIAAIAQIARHRRNRKGKIYR